MAERGTERHRGTVTGVDLVVTVYPKPRGPIPDADNTSAACKAYLDGIADALGINDRTFTAPRIQFAERCKEGRFVISITEMVAL
jgi:crossover junction endodeoxyribonuclease RusA